MKTPLYNPRDAWHKPFFLEMEDGLEFNKKCALSEADYYRLCEIYGKTPEDLTQVHRA